ncbi:helix-turn-helix domain-containing protein [Pelotomaculum terephthalicicum JT]|uniref:helix-turn-helix domain-containing protein n=1 Tax=Pelotomaculum terephthalicicum TaxID=206393 RepID=UPI0009D06921|nr:helix-turn-helix domain-containing protein [Pelotomaculum terephthalicicum]MCG9969976.1 helix-turn-helix domain-containing protein [Pelotomaculum terephthalicicum JT]OPX90358.1 MAG: hypothetical protein A4E53_01041 [Pelotomaculum sp. PtaB.Bin104]OPY58157.1 MAG: hypothetical protein A4E56_03429 [Pelotomaculum sp. PtaU1.Bin065]
MTDKTLVLENPKLKNGFTSIPNAVMMAMGLSIGAKFMYGLLLMFAWQENECFPGQERLAIVAEISIRQVQRYLFELRDYGLITWRRRGQNQTNVYYIKDLKTVERLKMPDATNMSCPDATNMSHKEYSVKRSVVVEQPHGTKKISNSESAGSSVENDGAAFDLQLVDIPDNNSQKLQGNRKEKSPAEEIPHKLPAWEQIRANVRKVAGADISISFAKEILERYPPEKVSLVLGELDRQLSQGIEIRGVGSWLRYALKNDIQPDQPARANFIPEKRSNNNRTPRAGPGRKNDNNYTLTPEQEKKKKFIKSLYV